MTSSPQNSIAQELRNQFLILGTGVVLMWAVEILDVFVFRRSLDQFGIRPLELMGLVGILWAPFLHGGLGHLIANTLPFITLGWLVMLQETSDFFIVTVATIVLGGLGTWLFGGAGTIHIGASGVIFGYLGFLLFRGLFRRNLPSIVLSVVVAFVYGGLLWGVLPIRAGVSWQGHLFGFIGGAIVAKFLSGKPYA